MTKGQANLMNRLMLAQAYLWIKQVSDSGLEMPPIAYKIRLAGHNSFHINRFDDAERELIQGIATDERMVKIAERQTSPIIQALHLMKIWVEDIDKKDRPNIYIADAKLKTGKIAYMKSMLALKKNNPEDHAEKTSVINDSCKSTEEWYNICKEIILTKDI